MAMVFGVAGSGDSLLVYKPLHERELPLHTALECHRGVTVRRGMKAGGNV